MNLQTIRFRQHAMATLFEGWLVGEDTAHLRAVSNLLRDEILRVEQLLSRYDPAAELARLNRKAPYRSTKSEKELLTVLEDCLQWYEKTAGYFDISINRDRPHAKTTLPLSKALRVDPAYSEVRYRDSHLALDLGGYGKGYALDKLGEILNEQGVSSVFLHGGKSSFLIRGKQADGTSWKVRIGDEIQEGAREGLSYSGAGEEKQERDIYDPFTAKPISQPLDCAVWAPDAVSAEVYSTAIIAMGPSKAKGFISTLPASIQVQMIQSVMS